MTAVLATRAAASSAHKRCGFAIDSSDLQTLAGLGLMLITARRYSEIEAKSVPVAHAPQEAP